MDVAVKGDVIEVLVDSDADDLKYRLSRSGRANGYVLDLPGQWILPRGMKMTRDFSTTNVAQLRMGLHPDYFRVVFSLRDGTAGPPTVERQGGGLRIVAK
ncbi:MAG: AMIN domain-containing protein [Pseudomonadota bacterium]|nr:AMIN domain-containing protein [Pseudomonadota bacterium]